MVQGLRGEQLLLIGIGHTTARTVWEPAADVFKTQDGWAAKLELPGVRREDISVSVQDRTLVVSGLRRDCPCAERATHLRMEIAYGPFERSIDLPAELSRAQIRTNYLDGMLIIHIRTGA